MNNPPFDEEAKRKELSSRISEVTDQPIPEDRLSKRPAIDLGSLVESDSCDRFLEAFNWVLEQLKEYEVLSPPENAN